MKTLLALLALTSLPAFAGPIRARQMEQQHRIAEGARCGQLNPHEAFRLQRQEGRLNARIARDRFDGGRLTHHERRGIERQQNRLSRSIYRERHDFR